MYYLLRRSLIIFCTLGARALTKKGSRPNDEEEASDREQEKENDKENQNTTNQNDQQPKTKKIRKRKNISTITKNPDSLNGRLDTNPLTDPFFAKLNSVIGDTTSSKRLMQNIIPTADSKLKLRQNIPIWFSTDQEYGALDEDEEYTNEIALRKVVSSKPVFRRSIVPNTYVRLGLSTYRIVNTTLEQVDDNEGSFRSRYGDDLNHSEAQNSFHMELQFDINAEVAPVPHEKSIVMDYGEMDNEDFEDLNEVDLVAVGRCKGLRREPVIIEDMQPENSLSLEYSYRPLGIIDQFWAGPSHWKFRQSRRTGLSMGTRASHFTNHSTEQFGTAGQRNKVVRKRKIVKTLDVTVEDVCIIDNCIVEKNLVEKITPNMRGMQLTNQTIAKKWDSKKHKLPVDYKLPLDAFEKLSHASSIHVNSNRDATFTGDDDGTPYNYQNAHDRDYCSRVAESQSDTETETNTDMGQMDNNMEFDNNDLPPTPAPIDEIPDVFEGAPERIEKINIAFARRAKVVDMKQLKLCSWTMINNKHLSDPLTYPKFSEILRELPKVLSRSMAENMSMPLAFYAVLHLCNDKGLLLNQNDAKLQDFVIEFVN